MKLPLLVFVAALLHHIAKACHAQGVGLPHRLFFSGNGAQMVNILCTDTEKNELAELAKRIWRMTSNDCPPRVTVEILKRPKEATAKGGLSQKERVESCQEKVILERKSSQVEEIPTVSQALASRELLSPEIESVFKLLDGLKIIHREFSFEDHFGISRDAMNKYTSLIEELKTDGSFGHWTRQGLEELQSAAGPDEPLRESPFFYALRGFLPHLASHIS